MHEKFILVEADRRHENSLSVVAIPAVVTIFKCQVALSMLFDVS